MTEPQSRKSVLASFLDPNPTHRVLALSSGLAAFDSRRWLIRNAKRRIWISSFLWRNDRVGNALVDDLANRASEGLDVRILIDHWAEATSQDSILFRFRKLVDSDGLQVRLFNPIGTKLPQSHAALAWAGVQNADNLNHRMHSKIAVFDDHAAIVGGRNVGDEYFDLHSFRCFADAELLIAGPSLPAMSNAFDKFWDNQLSVDLKEFAVAHNADEVADPRRQDPEEWETMLRIAKQCCPDYTATVFEPDHIEVVCDTAESGGSSPTDTADATLDFFNTATSRLQITSPILIFPNAWLRSLRSFHSGHPEMHTSLLTNSLASTDNLYTYAAGLRQRRQILMGVGAKLYEIRAQPRDIRDIVPSYDQMIQEEAGRNDQPSSGFGSNKYECQELHTTLHAKYAVVDHERLLLGSPNLDPRSLLQNMEIVLILDDSRLSEHFAKLHDLGCTNRNSWVVANQRRGRLPQMLARWTGRDCWPYRTPHCFEPLPSTPNEAVDPSSTDFGENYRSCGIYPGITAANQRFELFLIKNFSSLMRKQL